MDKSLGVLALCGLLSMAPFSARAVDCLPQVRDGWVRQPPMTMPMMAGFARIENPCTAPVAVVGAASPAFEGVELHETRNVDGVSRMRHVPELDIPAGDAAVLQPGGLHLMLMRPKAPLQPGDKVAIELELADGRTLSGQFEVRKPAP